MQIERIENQLKKSVVTEHVINILKATLLTVQFTGGLAPLISDYIPSQRQMKNGRNFIDFISLNL